MKRARKYNSPILSEIERSKNLFLAARSRKKLEISALILDAIENRGINKGELAAKLDKHNSEITKWVSGVHNFSIDTLSDIEEILGIRLLRGYEESKSISSRLTSSVSNIRISNEKQFVDYRNNESAAITSKVSDSEATGKLVSMPFNKFACHGN